MPLPGLLIERFDVSLSRSTLDGIDSTIVRAVASADSRSDASTRALLLFGGRYVAGGTATWALAEIDAATSKVSTASWAREFNSFRSQSRERATSGTNEVAAGLPDRPTWA
jgi:hypothetical protein